MYKAFTPDIGPALLDDPGASGTITFDMWGQQCLVVTATAEARTLARPTRAGILASVVLDTDAGDLTLTVTGGYNEAGDTSITFADAGDMVAFLSVKTGTTYQWTVVTQEGTSAPAKIADLTATSLKLAVTAVAAAGSTIGEGGDLVAGLNVVSAADNTKCVDLPATVAGTVVIVSSQTAAKTLPVFPPASSSIDNLNTNLAMTIGAATGPTGAVLVADNATHWVSILGDTA
jgi:hypothetical protein